MANGAVFVVQDVAQVGTLGCDRLPVDSRAAAQATAVASEAGQGQQQLAQQGRSAMTSEARRHGGTQPEILYRLASLKMAFHIGLKAFFGLQLL